MKKKQDIPLIILLLLVIISPVYADKANNPFVLVIDAGHGGKDPGALGKFSKEKDINLAVATLVGEYIKEKHPDVKVVYTRKKDVFIDLRVRTDIANKAAANLFISIHSNASKTSSVNGAEVYVLSLLKTQKNLEISKRENNVTLLEENYQENYRGYDPRLPEFSIWYEYLQNKHIDESLRFAANVQQELIKSAQRKGNGVKQAGFWVLVGAAMPCILVEIDYITNPQAEDFIAHKTGQEKIAFSIVNAFSIYKKEYDSKKSALPDAQITSKDAKNEIADETTDEIYVTNKAKKGKKIVYRVQILTTSFQLPKRSQKLKGYNVDFYIENNLYKYTYGESSNWDEITQIRRSVLKDFKDAFIVKFENGTRVSINTK